MSPSPGRPTMARHSLQISKDGSGHGQGRFETREAWERSSGDFSVMMPVKEALSV